MSAVPLAMPAACSPPESAPTPLQRLSERSLLNLPQFVRGVREFYLGTLHGHLASQHFDSVRAVDTAWLTGVVLEAQGQPLPDTPLVDMTVVELAAFKRFCECAEDGQGYDVDKDMMRRLADIGLVRSTGFGRFTTTRYGDAVRAQASR